jgi:DNA primase
VLGFVARAVGERQQPRYLNSSDNAIYHKGRQLFGADIARAPARVIVAERCTEVIAMHQAGLRYTGGSQGRR